jgi:hypothetical protein
VKSRSLALLPAVSALLATPTARAVAGAKPSCGAVSVESDARVRARFPRLVERIRDEFAARSDVDTCARVELNADGDAIGVSVALPDGRAASRTVARSVDVVPTLEALLVVPEHAPAEPSPRVTPSPVRRFVARKPRLAAVELTGERPDLRPDTAPGSRGAEPRGLGFELSLITGARLGDEQVGLGGGVLSFVEVQGWLAGFEGRADRYESIQGEDRDVALELGLLCGRRFYFDGVALDLTAGPAVAMEGFAFSETRTVRVASVSSTEANPPPPQQPPPVEASGGPLPRLLLGARLGFRARSAFRTFVGIDGELGPTHSTLATEASAHLPVFAVGIALGATLGTP